MNNLIETALVTAENENRRLMNTPLFLMFMLFTSVYVTVYFSSIVRHMVLHEMCHINES